MSTLADNIKTTFFNVLVKKAVEKKLLNNSFLFTPAKKFYKQHYRYDKEVKTDDEHGADFCRNAKAAKGITKYDH